MPKHAQKASHSVDATLTRSVPFAAIRLYLRRRWLACILRRQPAGACHTLLDRKLTTDEDGP